MTDLKTSTYTITIYVGLKEGYEGKTHSFQDVIDICQSYCDEIGLCLSVTETTYVYTGGQESGAIVGLINYPRFPSSKEYLEKIAMKLAHLLLEGLGQLRLTVVLPNKSITLEKRGE